MYMYNRAASKALQSAEQCIYVNLKLHNFLGEHCPSLVLMSAKQAKKIILLLKTRARVYNPVITKLVLEMCSCGVDTNRKKYLGYPAHGIPLKCLQEGHLRFLHQNPLPLCWTCYLCLVKT